MDTHHPERAPTGPPPVPHFEATAPLGGTAPVPEVVRTTSNRRELVLVAALLVLSVVAGASSLMPWRDWGRQFGAPIVETGWERPDGSLGRGWIAVALAVLVAAAGVLVAAERRRAGRTLAVLSGLSMATLAVAEWGLGAGRARTGPGSGIWVLLAVGVLVVVAVGATAPPDPATSRAGADP